MRVSEAPVPIGARNAWWHMDGDGHWLEVQLLDMPDDDYYGGHNHGPWRSPAEGESFLQRLLDPSEVACGLCDVRWFPAADRALCDVCAEDVFG